ncbi:MAG TPA: tetratricopeptide repeat protein [Novosphingobium sp.]
MSGRAKKQATPSGIGNRVVKLYQRGDYRGVVRAGKGAGRHEHLPARALLAMAASHERLAQPDEAAAMYRAAMVAAPEDPAIPGFLADLLRRQRRLPEAIAVCEQGLAGHPQAPELHYIHGASLSDALRHVDALNAYCRLLAIRPDHVAGIHAMGVTLAAMGQPERAIEAFCTALMVDPHHADAARNLGQVLTLCERLDEAIAVFRLALERDPGNHFLRLRKCYQQLHVCDWSDFAEIETLLDKPGPLKDAGTPFVMLAFADDPAVQLRHARNRAEQLLRETGAPPAPPVRRREPGARIRIGYLSADFHDHATMHLMAGLFREHDRGAFDIHAFSHGPDCPDHALRRLVVDNVDSFTDLNRHDDAAAAALIRAADLDILIDLKGYTKDARSAIMAHRPAPLQIAFVGFPGTMGAPFIDYLVSDAMVIPAAQRRHYTERILYLPGCYQPTDDRRPIAPVAPTRRELGLPDAGFVFCCFNQTYKITPCEFDLWMRLLDQTADSVLWLLGCNQWAEANLRAEATARGIDPQRLVFAEKLPQDQHLARIAQADLFLDTFRVNAHTTMSDALWAGLPAVTLAGRQFAARVGASILTAAGLPDLIAETAADYERLCLDLARDPSRLAAVRARVAGARSDCALFDTISYTRHYEAGLREVFARAQAGLPPADLVIAAGDGSQRQDGRS